MEKTEVALFWFRRDLRLHDNSGLYHALKSGLPVIPIFIFDRLILDKLSNKADARLTFIYKALESIQSSLLEIGSSLVTFYNTPEAAFTNLIDKYNIKEVFTNEDYEPYAKERDSKILQLLQSKNIAFNQFKDQVIFAKDEVLSGSNKPYTVFTPFSKKWKSQLQPNDYAAYKTEDFFANFFKQNLVALPTLESMGFSEANLPFPTSEVSNELITNYSEKRNFPGIPSTSRIGVHLRFGTVSIRELVKKALPLSEVFLNELIWRDFYHQVLWHFPQTSVESLKPEYDRIQWVNNKADFQKWCDGNTGYPMVDAGMRELNATGFMHNRVRMVVASFLTKHLLIDWRWGEAYFAEKLLDYDMAANIGGWQWAAGSGADAAPYFRIFNPMSQALKFDPKQTYIKHWVPEYGSTEYSHPMVDHNFARSRALSTYQKAVQKTPIKESTELSLFPNEN